MGHGAGDCSDNGDAFGYFIHDPAHSRASRWGEDGVAISEDKQRGFALALLSGQGRIILIVGMTSSFKGSFAFLGKHGKIEHSLGYRLVASTQVIGVATKID
jgi:hypothetical protein